MEEENIIEDDAELTLGEVEKSIFQVRTTKKLHTLKLVRGRRREVGRFKN